MRLGLRELRRRPGRFAAATVTLTLLSVLVMFLGGLLDGLIASATGALRAQDGDVIVYSDTARANLARSDVDPQTRATVESTEGVRTVGGLGFVQLGARQAEAPPREITPVVLYGYELAPAGVPDAPEAGAVYAQRVLESDGVDVGMTLLLGPARVPVTVVDFVDDLEYSGQATLWAEPGTWREVLGANQPDTAIADGDFQALVVQTDEGSDPAAVAAAIDDATGGATASFTLEAAIEEIPGVREQRSTFNQIISVTVAIAGVVVALFFALLTIQRLALYGVLKALGARTRTLFLGVLTQAVAVTLVASAGAAAITLAVERAIPAGGVPLEVTVDRLATSTALLLVAAVIGCVFSLRRLQRVDPATAIGGSP